MIADIGCGPGTSAVTLLERGYQVVGVEPNAEMRAVAKTALGRNHHFSIVDGTAESTGLADHSVDLVLAAQAFHWFNVPAARQEFLRILRRPPWVALTWNTMRMDTPFMAEYESLLQQFGTDYRQVHHKLLGDDKFATMYPHGCRRQVFANVQSFNFDGLAGRLRSSSFIPRENDPPFTPMMAELQRVFEQHQCDGIVRLDYDAELFLGVAD